MPIPTDKARICSLQISNFRASENITVEIGSTSPSSAAPPCWALYGITGDGNFALSHTIEFPLPLERVSITANKIDFQISSDASFSDGKPEQGIGPVVPPIRLDLYLWATKDIEKIALRSEKDPDIEVLFAFNEPQWFELTGEDTVLDWPSS
jgi:hypothetical protein